MARDEQPSLGFGLKPLPECLVGKQSRNPKAPPNNHKGTESAEVLLLCALCAFVVLRQRALGAPLRAEAARFVAAAPRLGLCG
jgi:hypothetical protein